MKKYGFIRCAKIAVFGIFAISLVSFILMQLWNWLVPYLFNGPAINFLQSLGLLVLSKILFSGFGRKCRHCQHEHQKGFWRQKFDEKMGRMTPEEKERFRERFRGCWSNEAYKRPTEEKINNPI